MTKIDTRALLAEAKALDPQVIELRRAVHAHPELGLDLPVTQALVLAHLETLGIPAVPGDSLSSVVATIEGGQPGPTTLLRADMDALALVEETDLPFASKIPGVMHACGHDAHVAMLLGAAQLLMAHRSELRGSVILAFQPGEEGAGGARRMIEEGLVDPKPDRCYAQHVFSNLPSGIIATRGGPMMASADEFLIVLTGRGGHASAPHDALDPIPVAAELVMALQVALTRRVNVFDPAVLTVGQIEAGTTFNIIPELATVRGTFRALSEETRAAVEELVSRVAHGIADAHGVEVAVSFPMEGYPVTLNDAAGAERALGLARTLVGEESVHEMETPVMGAEDFSYMLQASPGAMIFLGVAPSGIERPAPNHSNKMLVDEAALHRGVALHALLALAD
ncbi:M20 metallopeptidase family protein [Ferrimicrobium acidiphilum]|uniref:M20 metallopeptidase family protein n=1 Tax=Ferrimicrobium acidiphilum TaxID=121039 RepID=UPI0023F57F51|nr:M20 family metallopeptidase [Ferrimicrobium acidiphilum]